jgi:hypothetical protein
MCKCYHCQNKEDLPDGRPVTDFVLMSAFQVMLVPQLVRRHLVYDMLAPVRDVAFMRRIWMAEERLLNDHILRREIAFLMEDAPFSQHEQQLIITAVDSLVGDFF